MAQLSMGPPGLRSPPGFPTALSEKIHAKTISHFSALEPGYFQIIVEDNHPHSLRLSRNCLEMQCDSYLVIHVFYLQG